MVVRHVEVRHLFVINYAVATSPDTNQVHKWPSYLKLVMKIASHDINPNPSGSSAGSSGDAAPGVIAL